MPVIRERLEAGYSVRFFPKGTSMLPMLRQGRDSVLLSPLPSNRLHKYDLPLYQRSNGQYVLHRIVNVGDTYTCIGDNQFVYEYDIQDDQIIGVVTAFYREKSKISVQNFCHRAYCRLWHYTRPVRFLWHRGVNRLRRLFS